MNGAERARAPLPKLYCCRCGHLWPPRKDAAPKMCPRCKSSRWDTPLMKDAVCAFCGCRWHMSKPDEKCPECGRLRTDLTAPDMLHCNQCDNEWRKRTDRVPKKCPVCMSSKWDEEKVPQLTCYRCGHVWRMRAEKPNRCPECQSTKWNVPNYKFQCRRCGYKWITCRTSEEAVMCPSCKSRKWNEAPNLTICKSCGTYYIKKSDSVGSRCPSCTSKKRLFEATCRFCMANWSSATDEWTICPRCGKPRPDEEDRKTIELWSDGRFSLKYCYADGFSYIYLWERSQPAATMYLHDLLCKMNITADQFAEHLSSSVGTDRWRELSEDMYEHKNDYLENVPYFMKRLNLCEFDATVLSIHFTGMGPEAIAVKFGISMREVRKSFDRIMEAYIDSGIVVNDSIFTHDPTSYY